MRLKELRGLPVIDPTAARKIGTVQDYQIDPVSGRLAALDINSVENGDGGRIAPAKVHSCSRELMMFATGRLTELPTATTTPVVEEPETETETPTLSLRMPLKAEDRLPEPSFDQVPEEPLAVSR